MSRKTQHRTRKKSKTRRTKLKKIKRTRLNKKTRKAGVHKFTSDQKKLAAAIAQYMSKRNKRKDQRRLREELAEEIAQIRLSPATRRSHYSPISSSDEDALEREWTQEGRPSKYVRGKRGKIVKRRS